MTDLTEKEIKILQLAADGCRVKEIALKLKTSEQTVRNIRSDIVSKVDCVTFTQAVVQAVRQGEID